MPVHVCKEHHGNIASKTKNGGKGGKQAYINNFSILLFLTLFILLQILDSWLFGGMAQTVKGNIAARAASSFVALWLHASKLLGWAGGLRSPLVLTLSLCHFCS